MSIDDSWQRRLTPLIIVGAALLVATFIIFFSQATSVSASNPFDITFPISELGACASPDECKTYCNDLSNAAACAAFARKHGLATEQQAEAARTLPKTGPGGCNSESSCKSYCDDSDHTDECLAFAEEHKLLPPAELARARTLASKVGPGGCRGAACKDYCESPDRQDECLAFAEENGLLGETELRDIKKGREVLERGGGGPGGCRSEQQCRAYCDDAANLNECVDFGERSGFLSKEEAARIRKLAGAGPGGCKGKNECKAYCDDPGHAEECIAFATENGLISKEEAERAKRLAGKTGPGGCRSEQQCRAYCDDASHTDECLDFAEREGILPKEEVERAKKFRTLAAQAGPGGCRGVEQCREFCSNPVNREACFNFAKDQGLIPPEELGRIERDRGLEERVRTQGGPGGCRDESSCFQYCSNPTNTVSCLNFAVEHGGFSREEAEKSFQDWQRYRAYGDQLRDNSDAFLAPEGQFGPPVAGRFGGPPGFPPPPSTGVVPPGFTPPGFSNFTSGPGGCSSPQECSQYCAKTDNYSVCRDFFRGGKVEAAYQGPASVATVEFGPGGCRGLNECLRYCQDPSHQPECSRFGSGPTTVPPPPGLPGQTPPVDAPRFCPQVFEPVCGVNNVTYGNRCEAGFIPIAYPGRCAETRPIGGGLPGGCTTAECAQRYCADPSRAQSPECRSIPIPQGCPSGYRLEALAQSGFTCRPVTEATGSGCNSEATCNAVCYNASILDYNSQACVAFRQARHTLPPTGTCPTGQYWYLPPSGGAGYCQSGTTPPPGGCPSGEQWDGARCAAVSGGCVSESTCSAVCYNTTHPDYNASSCVAFRQSRTTSTSSCDSALTGLLGSGCHYMYNDSSGSQIYCDGPMTKSAKRGDTATAAGCTAPGSTTTQPPAGQREMVWNSLGLRSWIRTDADPARIEQLKQACANVSGGTNIWTSGAGTYSDPDFGMPDSAKCRLAASCAAGQTFDGTACVSSSTTTPPGTSSCDSALTGLLGSGCHYMYNDSSGSQIYCDGPMTKSAKRGDTATAAGCTGSSSQSCPSGQYWNGTSCVSSTTTTCPSGQYWYVPPSGGPGYCQTSTSTTCPSGQYWYVPPSGGAGYCKTTSSTDCPSGQYWNGTSCVSSTSTSSCPAGYHSMGSYCMSDSNSSICQPFGGGATYTCSGGGTTTACNNNNICDYGESTGSCPSDCGSTTACPSGQYWYVPPSGGAGYCQTTTTTSCPSGQYWNGTSCVSSTTTSSCPSGYHSMGSYCMSDSDSNTCQPFGGGGVYPCSGSTGGSQTCPSGQYWYVPPSGGTGYCQTSSTSCPSGQYWYVPPSGGAGYCQTTSSTDCPSGQYWNGTSCVSSTTTTCPSDQYWNGTSCVSSTTTTCPADQYWNGTSCVTSTYTPPPTTTTCPADQYWNGTACVSSSPPPQSLVGTIISAFVSAFVALFTR
ncbi:hypothetical protein HYW67_02665 [Candidatus Parcubacteria bacterium]|nr:hypothetical protein [Candidatus Parcubacteria bacterium]